MAQHNELGKRGEDLAEAYLIENGYRIIQRNGIYNKNEVDIIASNSEFIIFVEVKTRSTSYWGDPKEAVSAMKIKRIVTAADHYLNENDINKPVRFDVIAIVINKNHMDIEHIEDAFLAPLS